MESIQALYDIYRRHPKVSTDTRKLEPGCIFFALKGDSFDGNAFAHKALAEGASHAVIDDPAFNTDPRCILVPNVLETLQRLANYHRRQFMIPVIAIGGSNGKTTTKELVSAVLGSQYPCHFTRGNLNNQIGVPLTLLEMPADTEVAVVEMGANHAGDMEELCRIAEPSHGLLTNIGKEHLEGFGSLEGVKKAEGELYAYLRRNQGWVFVDASEKYLRSMSKRNERRLLYNRAEEPKHTNNLIDVQFVGETPFVCVAFPDENGNKVAVQTQLVGRHNFHNIMTAIALGIYFKVPSAKIKAAIEAYRPANNRSQLLQEGGNTILLDAYNANPSSMEAALATLHQFPAGRKVAILGDMLELGAESAAEHQAILRKALRYKFDALVLVGPNFKSCQHKTSQAIFLPDARQVKEWLSEQKFNDTFILVKGSRGIKLETAIL